MPPRDVPRFRITAWLGGPLPLPPVYHHRYLLDEGRQVLIERDDERAQSVIPSGETYLRLAEVNVEDPEDILRFANEHGTLGVYEPSENWRLIKAPLHPSWKTLEPYVDESGHAAPPASYLTDDGRKLGVVVEQRNRYRNQTLSAERLKSLESQPGWTWNVADAEWERAWSALSTFARQYGSATPPATYVNSEGIALGAWVAAQRVHRRRGTLSTLRQDRLQELPGWAWDPLDSDWATSYAMLADYAGEVGHAAPPALYVTPDGFRLGGWVRKQRERHRQDRLAAERRDLLEALPGWLWKARSGPARQEP